MASIISSSVPYLSDRYTSALADELASLKERLSKVEAGITTPQLGTSSIDAGYISIYDEAGRSRARIGLQADGTYVGGVSMNSPTPPPTPAAPTVTALIAGFRVTGNGRGSGGAWPADFAFLKVWVQQQPTGTGITAPTAATAIGTLPTGDSSFVHAPVEAGTTWEVWLTAVNLSGRESAPSPTVSVSPNQVVGADILNGAIDELALADGAVSEAKILAAAVTATKVADDAISSPKIVAGAVLADHIATGAVQAGHLAAGSVTARAILALSITSDLIAANAIKAGHIEAGAVTAAKLAAELIIAGRVIAGNPVAGRVEIHPTRGLQAFQPDGITQTFHLDATTGELVATGTWRTGLAGQRAEMNPDGSIHFHGGTSDYYSEISSIGDNVFFRARTSGPDVNQGYLYLQPDRVYIGYGVPGLLAISHVVCQGDNVELRAPIVGFRVERRFGKASDGTNPRFVFIQQDQNGNQLPSYIHLNNKGIDEPGNGQTAEQQIIWFNGNVGLLGSQGWGGALYCSRYDTSQPAPLVASAFTVTSSVKGKANIRRLEREDGALFAAFTRAPALRWRRKQPGDLVDPDRPELGTVPPPVPHQVRQRLRNLAVADSVWDKLPEDHPDKWVYDDLQAPDFDEFDQLGPVAEHLEQVAPELVRTLANGEKVVNIGDLVGYAWEALRRLVEQRERKAAADSTPFGGLAIPPVNVPPPPPNEGALLYAFGGRVWSVDPGGARQPLT